MNAGTAMTVRGVTCELAGRSVLRDVDLDLAWGSVTVVVGPNGAGKSTLLAVLAGDRRASAGTVLLEGRSMAQWSGPQLARRRAVLTQDQEVTFGFTVREVVAMGRHPWTDVADLAADEAVVRDALESTDVRHLADRPYRTLSGGEKARVSLARVLAQDTPIVLLDEPTAALDLRHTEEVLGVARSLARAGRCVVVVAHDLTLASAYADLLVIVDGGRIAAHGRPADVLTPELIERTYGLAVDVHPLWDRLAVVPRPRATSAPTPTRRMTT